MAGARASTRHKRKCANYDVIFDHNLSDNTIRRLGEGCYDTTPNPAKAIMSTPLTSYNYYRVTFYNRTGYMIMYNNYPIIWDSRLETEIAFSTTEMEYIALSEVVRYFSLFLF